MLLAFVLSTAQAGEPTGTLTLACEGTATDDIKPKPISISMGIIVNFADRTVKGFGIPTLDEVKVNHVNETEIAFVGDSGGSGYSGWSSWTIVGHIDRVTGDLEATTRLWDLEKRSLLSRTRYSLKCKPTRGMF
jgi:hypothetical protein